jgi:hypothetical protein
VTLFCQKCQTEKPDTEFYKSSRTECKECTKARVKKRAQENPTVQVYDRERAKLPHRRANAKRVQQRWLKEFGFEKTRTARANSPEAYKARTAVSNALRGGKYRTPKIFKGPCVVCGTTEKITAHHDDYSRPLDVVWVCAQHHADLHPKWHRPYIVEITGVTT